VNKDDTIPTTFVKDLDEATSLAEVGGKALNLGRMLRADLPVPEGFVLTTRAYRAFVEAARLGTLVAETCARLPEGDLAAWERASAEIRAAFERSPVPETLAAELREAYRKRFGSGPVAVRSSATAEDLPEASFAGQQDSYLGIQGAKAVVEAVRRCWGSLWTARAMAYRARLGIGAEDVALAVVVQRLVPARSAGVMFTAHPLSGDARKLVINATWGLGEALVSGLVSPDTLVVDKASGRVDSFELGGKELMTQSSEQGTEEGRVGEELRAKRSIGDAEVAALAGLGRALEELFGSPQDVEWAIAGGANAGGKGIDGGQLYLLQSRAITTIHGQSAQGKDLSGHGDADAVPGDDRWPPTSRGEVMSFDFWTQQDLGERWPDPITPLTWSLSEPMNQRLMESTTAGLGAAYAGRIQWTKRAFGHAYFNEGALLEVYTRGFGMPLSMIASGHTHEGAKPLDAERWRPGRVLASLPFYLRVMFFWDREVTRFERDFPVIERLVGDFMARKPGKESDAELLHEALDLWLDRCETYVQLHSYATSLSMTASTMVESMAVKAGATRDDIQALFGGLSGIIAAEMVPALRQIAAKARSLGLEPTVLDTPPSEVLGVLRTKPGAGALVADIEGFLARHGHRCMTEAEFLHPRWAEAPGPVLEQVAAILRAPERSDTKPPGDPSALREAATARVEALLGPWLRPTFRWYLGRAQRFIRLRDNGQHYVVKLLLPLRRLIAELGTRWSARGWLDGAEDVFFLVREELESAVAHGGEGAPGLDLRALASARRSNYDYWCARAAPDALDAAGLPVPSPGARDPAAAAPEGSFLQGIAASPGVVTGTARVLHSATDAARLGPGDILVTRATDPGWTPLFSRISGVVVEIGGLLSHSAIVAREYGIPAVVNVAGATRSIKDGETIRLDGGTGRVYLVG
jgi:pyruvate,water dikinase